MSDSAYQKQQDDRIEIERNNQMKHSKQLTLIELILKLEQIKNSDQFVLFDDVRYCPTDIASWRGSYSELSLWYEHGVDVDKPLIVKELISILHTANGSRFTGYKGGEFIMGKSTPIWVANYGESEGFERDPEMYQAVIGVTERDDHVVILTDLIRYL
jgi:hypothetical protein